MAARFYRALESVSMASALSIPLLPFSQEEMTLRVEMEYRLFLTIDTSLYRYKKIIFGGCAKFHPLAFLQEAKLSLVGYSRLTASQ